MLWLEATTERSDINRVHTQSIARRMCLDWHLSLWNCLEGSTLGCQHGTALQADVM